MRGVEQVDPHTHRAGRAPPRNLQIFLATGARAAGLLPGHGVFQVEQHQIGFAGACLGELALQSRPARTIEIDSQQVDHHHPVVEAFAIARAGGRVNRASFLACRRFSLYCGRWILHASLTLSACLVWR